MNLNDVESGPKKNWILKWDNREIDLYAINVEDGIVFADNDVNIFFKNHQIYEVVGLAPNNLVLKIDSDDSNLHYMSNDQIVSRDTCKERVITITEDFSSQSVQYCEKEFSNKIYTNKILMNSNKLITSLEFNIHPDYPMLELRIK